MTDSTSCFDTVSARRPAITVVAKNLHISTRSYGDNRAITPDEFCEKPASPSEYPTGFGSCFK